MGAHCKRPTRLKLTIEADVSKADHSALGTGSEASDPAGLGKFDHDLNVRAAGRRTAAAGRHSAEPLPHLRFNAGRDRMTLPDDFQGQIGTDAELGTDQPDPMVPVAPKPPVARREPLHFVVIVLLCADVIFGLGLAVFAEEVITFRPMAVMGLGLAALGLGILAYFVLIGGGAEKKRRW